MFLNEILINSSIKRKFLYFFFTPGLRKHKIMGPKIFIQVLNYLLKKLGSPLKGIYIFTFVVLFFFLKNSSNHFPKLVNAMNSPLLLGLGFLH